MANFKFEQKLKMKKELFDCWCSFFTLNLNSDICAIQNLSDVFDLLSSLHPVEPGVASFQGVTIKDVFDRLPASSSMSLPSLDRFLAKFGSLSMDVSPVSKRFGNISIVKGVDVDVGIEGTIVCLRVLGLALGDLALLLLMLLLFFFGRPGYGLSEIFKLVHVKIYNQSGGPRLLKQPRARL